jgi:mannose-6-phosphate isomerase-like protein (cupin superfamily)
MEVVDLNGGETIATGPITHRILEDGTHTGHRIGLLEVRIAPGTGGAPVHIHHEHDETFFVVSGTPSFTGGDETITAQPGTLVTAAAGTPHGFANPGEETAVILATVTRTSTSTSSVSSPTQGPARPDSTPTRSARS